MEKKYNWGIMAAGKIAEKFATALNFEENAEFYAIASRNMNKAEDFQKRYNAKKAYGSYEELVKDENVDIIYIATPMSCHYDNVKLCFEYNKNVLCEKTVTLNDTQFEELISIAKEKGLFFMEAMWMKCMPHFNKAIEWHKTGQIGEITAIKADFSNACYDKTNTRLFSNELGGGALLDICVYPLTFATAFLGYEPKNIMSAVDFQGCNDGNTGVDINETIILQYDKAFVSIFSGFNYMSQNRAVIIGTKGRIEFNPWFFMTDTVKLYNASGELVEESVTPHPCNGYEYEITETQNCLKDGLTQSRLIPLSDTLGVLKIMTKLCKDWELQFN